jgi:Cu-Zn family superoxide dismutase
VDTAETSFAWFADRKSFFSPPHRWFRLTKRRHLETAMPRALLASIAALALAAGPALAATVQTKLQLATPTGPGAEVGTAMLMDEPGGAMVMLNLHGLPPGQHGLHLHQNGSCAVGPGPDGKPVPAGAAGPHFDPAGTGHHRGPMGQGHLGDLPHVEVGADGTARVNLTAPHIKDVTALKGKALMLHAGGDTYSDTPPLGGGGARLACGVLN